MKKYKFIILSLLLIIIAIMLTGCTDEPQTESNTEYRFIKIYQKGSMRIFVDTETGVEYALVCEAGKMAGFTVLVNPDGTPIIYNKEALNK